MLAALRDLGLRNAGTPLLIASTPVRAAQPWVKLRSTRSTSASPVKASPSASSCRSALGGCTSSPEEEDARQPPDDHGADADHERVGRHGEGEAGLPDPPQVDRREHDDGHDAERHLVLADDRHQRAEVGRGRRDRDRDGQRVVHQQGAGHGQAGARAEVDRGDLVVAPARRIGPHVLAVARHHGQQHDHDRQPDPRGVRVGRHPGDRQRQEDLLGRVGDRRHRVGGEDRQRDALGQQVVGQPVAALRPADQDALDGDAELGHGRSLCPPAGPGRDSVRADLGGARCTS